MLSSFGVQRVSNEQAIALTCTPQPKLTVANTAKPEMIIALDHSVVTVAVVALVFLQLPQHFWV